jgi:hypothetical protein
MFSLRKCNQTPPRPWIASFGASHPSNKMVVKKKIKIKPKTLTLILTPIASSYISWQSTNP